MMGKNFIDISLGRTVSKTKSQFTNKTKKYDTALKSAIETTATNIKKDADSASTRYSSGFKRGSFHMRSERDRYLASVYTVAFYEPYHEFGTGRLVSVRPGWEQIAMQYKGLGIREVNIEPQPRFTPSVDKHEKLFHQAVEKLIEIYK